MAQLELDPHFIQGLRLLHSINKDSADQLRTLLDEAIRQKHGPVKMLSNVLHKKYTMEEPVLSDNSSGSSKRSKSSSSDVMQSDDNLALEISDLTCVVCKGMDVGARNRLVECAECHFLYHQECHVSPIQDSQIDAPGVAWHCFLCTSNQQTSKEETSPKAVSESRSKKEQKKSSSSSKHDKYKSSNGLSQSQSINGSSSGSSSSSSSKNVSMPNIQIISRDMMKKAKQDKRSSSSSSKHSSSSSSKSSHEKSVLYKMKSGSE